MGAGLMESILETLGQFNYYLLLKGWISTVTRIEMGDDFIEREEISPNGVETVEWSLVFILLGPGAGD